MQTPSMRIKTGLQQASCERALRITISFLIKSCQIKANPTILYTLYMCQIVVDRYIQVVNIIDHKPNSFFTVDML